MNRSMDSSGRKRSVLDMRPRCQGPKCGGRGKVLAESLTRPWVVKCPRCGFVNTKD